MSASSGAPPRAAGQKLVRAAQVIVVSSVMLSFISYWRTAAIVLCDLASTAYYIGGIVEQSVGPAAPWFILAVMLFSYCVRSVYIESCSLFVRGGVYRVVKEAMGGWLAKLSVSALLFDYVLTGPISGVSAGQYFMGLFVDLFEYAQIYLFGHPGYAVPKAIRADLRTWGSVLLACAVTLYFYWENLKGLHESSDKAVKIMKATTVMAVVIMIWCGITLAVNGPANQVPLLPDLRPHTTDFDTGAKESPLGFLRGTAVQTKLEALSEPAASKPGAPTAPAAPGWLSAIGFMGIAIAFGHSILA
ncbi:MAG TPA: APC family permease, partial [Pirellulales bacterium]|nr:APC family permease [Pirellulales bacterium]